MKNRQRCLWQYYRFDVIPLDFISSIYEEFVSKESGTGIHYTPEHIVDFILDGVLPWNSPDWNIKTLDPACGSGIFLVKAFQRLIYRWEQAHPNRKIRPSGLKFLLENNLFGVDVDAQAVRVASFSLYLTMLDKIEPQDYWENDFRFPRLRERQLINADFFQEDKEGFRSDADAAKYDLVIGNAPWGEKSMTLAAKSWAKNNNWESSYKNIGLLFLPKAAILTKREGKIAMMQPALPLIFNQVSTAKQFRAKLFSEFQVEEIVNLSALRFGLFKDAISPACIITLSSLPPTGAPLTYICPKPVFTNEDYYHIVIEPNDINVVYPHEAILDPFVWTSLMWGSRRDLALIRRLNQYNSLSKLESLNIVVSSQGIIRGSGQIYHTAILGRRILEDKQFTKIFPDGACTHFATEQLPSNENPYTHRLTDLAAFNLPQLIIKLSWSKHSKRFHAAITKSEQQNDEGIICSGSYVSVHIPEEYNSVLEAACLSYKSKLAVYYLLLSSGRFASYIPEVKPSDLLRVPIPELNHSMLRSIKTIDDIDERIRQAFEFKDSEWVLINDLFNYTLQDFKGDSSSPGRQRTSRRSDENDIEPELTAYCQYLSRVIKAGFGQDKQVYTTIFQEQNNSFLPVRLVAIYLNKPEYDGVNIERIYSIDLLKQLERLNHLCLERGNTEDGGIFYQRVARIYDSVHFDGQTFPTIYLIKPDKIRYWTRSMALRDADEVVADIMMWSTTFNHKFELKQESYSG
jgi:hypothetical protein